MFLREKRFAHTCRSLTDGPWLEPSLAEGALVVDVVVVPSGGGLGRGGSGNSLLLRRSSGWVFEKTGSNTISRLSLVWPMQKARPGLEIDA